MKLSKADQGKTYAEEMRFSTWMQKNSQLNKRAYED